jgi:hypothetical protein
LSLRLQGGLRHTVSDEDQVALIPFQLIVFRFFVRACYVVHVSHCNLDFAANR